MKKLLIVTCSFFLFTACSHETPVVEETAPLDASCAQETFCTENPDKCDASCQLCSDNPESECLKGDGPCSCEDEVETSAETVIRNISIDAKRFEYLPNEIRIKKGETVKIKVNNLDTTHNITIPAFEINNQENATFTATESGEFEFHCANMCGSGHGGMEGKIIVE